jgi:hypothetical protein
MTGIGPEFLKLLRGIEWDTLTARDAVDLRAALKEAVGKSDEWFLKLTQDFGGIPEHLFGRPAIPVKSELNTPKITSPVAAKVESGRPQTKACPPREPKSGASTKRKRGRPPKARPNPIVIGGANAQGAEAPPAAKLFENSYVSKDGPRTDIPATLPADHPRLNLHRESSVTPESDAQDFNEVERAIASGRELKDIFQVR